MATLIPNTYRRSGMYYARFRLPKETLKKTS